MSTGQVIATVALIAQMYSVDPALMDCLVYRESSYNVLAENGIHKGLAQYNPSTFEWFVEMALRDPGFAHAGTVRANPDPSHPITALVIMAWAIQKGYGPHWSTWGLCQ